MPTIEQCTLAGLPVDERRHVYAHLDPSDVMNLGQVCRSLRQASRDEVVWEQFCIDRWFNPHSVPHQTWKNKYSSDNGWNRYTLQSSNIAPSGLPIGARRAFDWHPSSSTGMVLQWSERRLHVHASSSPHDPDSWTTVGSFSAQHGHHQRSCCSLSPSRVVAADNRADLTVFRLDAPPGSEAGAAADGRLGPGGSAGVFEADDDRESSRKRNREADAAAPHSIVSMSEDGSLTEAMGILAPAATHIWALARSRTNRHQGWVVAVDVEAGRAARCRDFMEDYQYCGLCQHPGDPQVAVAVGVHSGGTCRTCLDADNPARPWSPAGMCEHRSAGATLTLMDMRAPRAVDRCTLLRPSVFHRVATSSAREHFVFTSHQSVPLCAWDLRNMSYPVYQGRLDHAAEPVPSTGLPQAVWHTKSKALFLGCHEDYMLGQADNGMLWHFDLSAMLGWSSSARGARQRHPGVNCGVADCRGGCWLQYRSSSDAQPGQWTHPQPLGVVAGDISASPAVFPVPSSPCGAFITSGFCGSAARSDVDTRCVLPTWGASVAAAGGAADAPPVGGDWPGFAPESDSASGSAAAKAASASSRMAPHARAIRPGHMHGMLLFQLRGTAPP